MFAGISSSKFFILNFLPVFLFQELQQFFFAAEETKKILKLGFREGGQKAAFKKEQPEKFK